MTTRVLIADDHAIVREGLRRILAGDDAFTVAGEARDGHEVLAAVRAGGFEVLLLDLSMPGRSGIELLRQVKIERPELRVLILSMHAEDQYAVRAIRAGASGYLTKDTASEQLVAALEKVAAGGLFITPRVAETLALGLQASSDELPHKRLSDREHQVFHAFQIERHPKQRLLAPQWSEGNPVYGASSVGVPPAAGIFMR